MVYVPEVLGLMKVCVVIPAYNEALKIAYLVEEVKKLGLDVLVIDDGSRDSTARLAAERGAAVLKNEINQGKGVSLKKGFDYALSKGFDAVIAMDGDGQHLPEEIPHFMQSAEDSLDSLFIGNRMCQTKNMPLDRYLTNKFMSWMISKVCRQHIPDTQCGYRLIKKELLDKLDLQTANYEIESEMLVQTARLGFKIISLPIKTVYTGTKSQINPLKDTWRFTRYILKAARRK